MGGNMDWTGVGVQVWAWLSGPFWVFVNAPFIAGLVPAMVGLMLTRRVAEVAETNKNVEAVRSAESQIHEIDRAHDVLELTTPIETAAQSGSAGQHSDELAGLPAEVVAALEEKIDTIKTEIRHLISELDGRKARKYETVSKYDYRPLVLMLAQDSAMSEKDAYALVEIFTVWNAHRLKKPMLPQEKADLILGYRLPRRHRRTKNNQPEPPPAAASEPTKN